MKVLSFGSLNIDYVYRVAHIVQPGETISSTERNIYFGGKGFNQSVAAAKAGAIVYHAGKIGLGGEKLLDECRKYGIDISNIEISEEETGHTMIQVDENGQNSIVLFGGSNQTISCDQVDRVLSGFGENDFLILQNEINNLEYIIGKAAEKGMAIVLNPSPCDEKILQMDLSGVRYLILNEVEGTQITGETEEENILQRLLEIYPDCRVVLTLGKKGSVYQDKNMRYEQQCYPASAVDTTGAGDTFLGYFVAGLVAGKEIPDIMDLAARAAAVTVSRSGAAVSIPEIRELMD